ncbi:hypothetical protein [Jannaschia seosinensis]|uniref:hypothetical protein n=1 Tax=Jannaschia seosinensis TaxID=313367 RepID=UPI000B02C199|nr:hypothetical protein [Jannaschia seosinensis]
MTRSQQNFQTAGCSIEAIQTIRNNHIPTEMAGFCGEIGFAQSLSGETAGSADRGTRPRSQPANATVSSGSMSPDTLKQP